MKSRNSVDFIKNINLPGVLTGILMLMVPFLGSWWSVSFGQIVDISLSPFHYEVFVMGEMVSIPLMNYVLMGMKALVLFGSTALILGSLFNSKEWSDRLSRFGFGKIFWPFVFFVISLLILTFTINSLPEKVLSVDEPFKETVDADIPYFVGTGMVEMEMEDATASVPIRKSTTRAFWISFFAISLGLFSQKFYKQTVGPRKDKKGSI